VTPRSRRLSKVQGLGKKADEDVARAKRSSGPVHEKQDTRQRRQRAQFASAALKDTSVDGLALQRMRSQSAAMTKRLPHGDQAILDMREIEDYCLNPSHPRASARAA
jgi:hypothetical protein